MSPLGEEDKKHLESFIKECMEEELLDVKRRIHRVWDAQEEMVNNHLMLAERLKRVLPEKVPQMGERPKLQEGALSLEQSFAELERIAPRAYAVWIKLFEAGKQAYLSDPVHNLCVDGNSMDKAFDIFGKLYLDKPGYLLDIGCGPQAVPSYLRNFPVENIFGMDPLPPFEKHPFAFSQNIAEYIPYENEQFDYVVLGTSLDHVLLLDKALDEMYRVLKKDGVLLVWAATLEKVMESKPYDPYGENIEAVDEYHMFHIAPQWFEKLMKEKWMKDSHYSDRYRNHFYAFRKKEL